MPFRDASQSNKRDIAENMDTLDGEPVIGENLLLENGQQKNPEKPFGVGGRHLNGRERPPLVGKNFIADEEAKGKPHFILGDEKLNLNGGENQGNLDENAENAKLDAKIDEKLFLNNGSEKPCPTKIGDSNAGV